jgi:hypothetical protein
VRDAVKSFYADFNPHERARAVNYTTDDWVTSTRPQRTDRNYDTYAIST